VTWLMHPRTLLPTSLLSLFLALEPAAAQKPIHQVPILKDAVIQIGVTAAVAGTVEVTSPGEAVGRIVESGKPIFLGDVITTDAEGRLQILLLDQTVFTIGANSAIVIDEFVYDPLTESGHMTAQVIKGVFRFATGKISKQAPEKMKVKLPVGTIGIRGTMVTGRVTGQHSLVALLGPGPNNKAGVPPGRIDVSNPVGNRLRTVVVSRPGYGTEIAGPNVPPTPPVEIPADVMNAMKQELAPPTQPEPEGGEPEGPEARATEAREDREAEGEDEDRRGEEGDEPARADEDGDDGGDLAGEGPRGPGEEGGEPVGPDGYPAPPTTEQLQAMADAGLITEAELGEMLADLEAWESGDPEVRAALEAKYGGGEGFDGEGPFEGFFGGPSESHLYAMLDAGLMTDAEFGVALADLEAWESGDPEVQAALMAKYAGDEGFGHFFGDDMFAGEYGFEGFFGEGFQFDPELEQYGDFAYFFEKFGEDVHFFDFLSEQAAHDAANVGNLQDGISTFDQLRSIETGEGNWVASGPFFQTQPFSREGTLSVSININFGTRVFGGAGSEVTVAVTGSGDTINQTVSIAPKGYANAPGQGAAVFEQVNGALKTFFDVRNVSGVIADALDVDVIFDNGANKVGNGSLNNIPTADGPLP